MVCRFDVSHQESENDIACPLVATCFVADDSALHIKEKEELFISQLLLLVAVVVFVSLVASLIL